MPSQPAPMHTPELKLCPFCKRLPERTGHMLQTGESVFWCGCLIAYCETVVGVTADRWNQRAPSPGEAALLAALQRIAKERDQLSGTAAMEFQSIARAALSAAQANEREGL